MAGNRESYVQPQDPETEAKLHADKLSRLPVSTPAPLALRSPAVMTTAELAAWCRIGKNAVPRLVTRFGIREISGNAKNHRYPLHSVLRAILGVTPRSPEDLESLLIPLQKASWVSQMTGLSISSISADVCQDRGALPRPVELTATGPGQAPARGRRWIPAQIAAHLRGDTIPFLAPQAPLQGAPETRPQAAAGNVFAAICSDNAEVSRQCRL